jgi:hypothetical protein
MERAEKSTAYKPPVRELATRIYVQFLATHVSFAGTAVKIDVAPADLARLSFKLAEAFAGVEDELNVDNLPKNVGYKLDAADISSWGTPK